MSDTTIDQQFIEYVVKTLVGKPEAVSIERTIDEKGVLLLLTVDPEDLGRVIGKRGATAQSMRTLLRALGTKNESRYNLKIVDNGYPKPGRDGDDSNEDDKPKDMEEKKPDVEDSPKEESVNDIESDFGKEEVKEDSSADDNTESAIEKTRRELEDLDDLDI